MNGTANNYMAGNLSINTSTTTAKINIAGAATTATTSISSTGTTTALNQMSITNTGGGLYWGVESSAGGGIFTGSSAYAGVLGTSTATSMQFATNNNIRTVIDSSGNLLPAATTTYNIGSATLKWSTVYATTFNGTATTAQYADLAECYAADAAYEPGTVLEFGGEEEVTLSMGDMSRKIAGIVSTDPAYLMNDGMEAEFVAKLGLQGRVPCKVRGIVRKGDMMVSAGDGFARAEEDPKLGSVIGKALEDFDGDQGVIEVVVGRL
jgi:hypothetical protein